MTLIVAGNCTPKREPLHRFFFQIAIGSHMNIVNTRPNTQSPAGEILKCAVADSYEVLVSVQIVQGKRPRAEK